MELLLHCAGLLVTFLVLERYMVSGIYSKAHRLLPLVLGLIALYDFYEIIQCITHATETFNILEDLLIVQLLYLMMHYFLEFLIVKWPIWLEVMLFSSLIFINGKMILYTYLGKDYHKYFYATTLVYSLVLLVFVVIVLCRYSYSKRQHIVSGLLYLAVLLPWLALGTRHFGKVPPQIVMTIALMGSCSIIYGLIAKDQFVEPVMYMRENIFQSADAALVLLDTDFYLLSANDEAYRMIPEELAEMKRDPKRSRYNIGLQEYVDGIRTELSYEKDGRHYQGHLHPVMHQTRQKGYILTVYDVTEQHEQLEEKERQKQEAQYQTILKSQFLARMSHDLRSPLHAILGISDILISKRDMLARERGLLLQMRHSGNTLLEMVNSILDYSKLEAGKMELKIKQYNFKQLLQEVSTNSCVNLVNKPIDFDLHMHTSFPEEMCGDESRVKEILQNVLSNAVKFTKEGKITCDCWCIVDEQRNCARVKFSVTDTGPGMNQAQLEQVFAEYVSYADSRTLEGSGLGLCIVRQLTEMMQGCAYATSDGKSGSTVTVEFEQELVSGALVLEEAFLLSGQELLGQGSNWKPGISATWQYPDAKVLMADDMQVNRQIFEELASQWGFQIVLAENGKQAVEKAKEEQFDLIFLDLMMPELSGTEAAAELRQQVKCPMIALTADTSASVEGLQNEYGFTDVLWKPINMEEFKRCVEEYLPEEKQEPIREDENIYRFVATNDVGYRKTLETYVKEVEPLLELLPQYLKTDLDNFRIKVHGIKGISRQIGKEAIGEQAEVMEMAAKAHHRDFIVRHLDEFLEALREVMEDVRDEAKILMFQEQMAEERVRELEDMQELEEIAEVEVEEIFRRIREGFAKYDMDQIETGIQRLKHVSLQEEQEKLLLELEEASEDFDYELGVELLENI